MEQKCLSTVLWWIKCSPIAPLVPFFPAWLFLFVLPDWAVWVILTNQWTCRGWVNITTFLNLYYDFIGNKSTCKWPVVLGLVAEDIQTIRDHTVNLLTPHKKLPDHSRIVEGMWSLRVRANQGYELVCGTIYQSIKYHYQKKPFVPALFVRENSVSSLQRRILLDDSRTILSDMQV